MSTQQPTHNEDGDKVEPQYLTLADKQQSLIRETGSESGRTISTRQLSDNLQATRDGMMNLMRKKKGNGRLTHGSDTDDDENNLFQNLEQPGSVSGSALYEITKGKLGALGAFGFGEFCNGLSSQDIRKGGGSNKESNNVQRGKRGLDMDSSDDYDRAENDYNNEKNKLLSSQNPKKDGPLHTRIFIDAFLPSLEANRIFPLFNYRCELPEKNKKRSNKQLSAVSSTEEECGNDNGENTTVQQIGKELQNVKDSRKVEEIQNVEELQNVKDLQIVEQTRIEDQSQKTDELRELNKVEEIQKSEKVEVQGLAVKTEEMHKVNEMEEVLELQKGQTVEERQAEVLPPSVTTNSDHPAAVENSIEHDKVKSKLNEKKSEAVETVDGTMDQSVTVPQVEPPSAEEEKFLQKIFRALFENQELIDFLCEKVISKIAARNDFCGPNCKGSCGGLNEAK